MGVARYADGAEGHRDGRGHHRSRHRYGRRLLYFDDAVPVGLHCRGDELLLAKEDPYRSYDMEEHGNTLVGPALPPDVLSAFVGARLTDGAEPEAITSYWTRKPFVRGASR